MPFEIHTNPVPSAQSPHHNPPQVPNMQTPTNPEQLTSVMQNTQFVNTATDQQVTSAQHEYMSQAIPTPINEQQNRQQQAINAQQHQQQQAVNARQQHTVPDDPQAKLGTQVPQLSKLVSLMYTARVISEEGRKYFKNLIEAINNSASPNLQIKVHELTSPSGSLALECHGRVILLVPTECLNIDVNIPSTVVLRKAMNCYRDTVATTHTLLLSMIVTPHDYAKLEVMVNNIINCFRVVALPDFQNMTIATLTNSPFIVNTNTSDVDAYLRTRYPHGVMPRRDMGFLLSIQSKDAKNIGYGNTQLNYFDQGNQDAVPIACVTGYTEVAYSTQTVNGYTKYATIVHITCMISDIPDFRMSALLLPLAADVFIRAKLYRNQFSQFDRNRPNLGKLFRNNDGTGFTECVNHQQRDYILDNYLTHPALVLDVQEGTYRIPGIEHYAIAESTTDVLNMYAKFTGAPVPAMQASQFYCHEYTGVINSSNGGELADSRWADYLNTMVHFESDAAQVQGFLTRDPNPKTRVDLTRRFYPTFDVLYSNFHTAVDLKFINTVQNNIRDKIKIAQNNILGVPNTVDLTYLVNNGTAFQASGQQGFAYGGQGAIYGNPMNLVYTGGFGGYVVK